MRGGARGVVEHHARTDLPCSMVQPFYPRSAGEQLGGGRGTRQSQMPRGGASAKCRDQSSRARTPKPTSRVLPSADEPARQPQRSPAMGNGGPTHMDDDSRSPSPSLAAARELDRAQRSPGCSPSPDTSPCATPARARSPARRVRAAPRKTPRTAGKRQAASSVSPSHRRDIRPPITPFFAHPCWDPALRPQYDPNPSRVAIS